MCKIHLFYFIAYFTFYDKWFQIVYLTLEIEAKNRINAVIKQTFFHKSLKNVQLKIVLKICSRNHIFAVKVAN